MPVALLRGGAILRVGAAGWITALIAMPAVRDSGMPLRVTVLVNIYAAVPTKTLRRAEITTSTTFRRAGIEIVWAECDFYRNHPGKCQPVEQGRGPIDLSMNVLPRHMADALAMPPDRLGGVVQDRAFILYDRIRQATEQTPGVRVPISVVLGYVMTHELGHILLGDDRHALEGIMRSKFRTVDCILRQQRKCLFNEDQAERMRMQLRALTSPLRKP